MRRSRRFIVGILLSAFLMINVTGLSNVWAISNFNLNLEIGFASDFDSEQGHVEYQINGGSWVQVPAATNINITEEVTSLKFKVVPSEYYEVNFDNGPYLADGTGVAFNAGGADAAREALIGEGYEANLTDGLTTVSLTGVAFRACSANNTANVSISIKGADIEYWEADIPSRIVLSINSGHHDDIVEFGSDNLTWEGGNLPPNATGVSTTNPVSYTYSYDNSGKVEFYVNISNANTKITSFKINGTDYSSQIPQTDDEILKNIRGGRTTGTIRIMNVPHAVSYNVEIGAEAHDLMGGFGWNYLPEETMSGDEREECIAHGTLTFVKGEYNGTVYNSVTEWESGRYGGTGEVFTWSDGDKNYFDEADAWGGATFPKGAKITMELIPDEGYQLVSLYGDENLVPEEEVGVYTITMKGGMNSHLSAKFEAIDDTVNASHNKVNNGEIQNAENIFNKGTLRLDVADTILSESSQNGFDQKADEELIEIQEYFDISLNNVIYKATNDANDSWERPINNLNNPASITLELADDYSDKSDLVIIHEHDGNYETIPVIYDAGNNSITFETSSFSNYALGVSSVNTITVNTPDGHGSAKPENPTTANENDTGILLLVDPDEGYVYDHHDATGISEDDENGYSILLSGWPTVGIMINNMPGNNVSFDVYFVEAVTVTYDANGGTPGEMWEDSRLIKKGQEEDNHFQITDDIITPPEGMEYDGVEIDGVKYGPNDSFTFDRDITVVFQWKEAEQGDPEQGDPCEITFDLNGAKAKNGDSEITMPFLQGEQFEVPSNEEVSEMVIIPECKEYGGIKMGGKVYKPGEIITIPSATSATLQIVWDDNHNWGEWIINKEPTETATGLKIRVCKNNSAHIQNEIIPTIGKYQIPNTGVHDDLLLYDSLLGASTLSLFLLLYFMYKEKKQRFSNK